MKWEEDSKEETYKYGLSTLQQNFKKCEIHVADEFFYEKIRMLNLISFQIYGEVEIVYIQTAEMKQIMEIPALEIHKLWGKIETFTGSKELGR